MGVTKTLAHIPAFGAINHENWYMLGSSRNPEGLHGSNDTPRRLGVRQFLPS